MIQVPVNNLHKSIMLLIAVSFLCFGCEKEDPKPVETSATVTTSRNIPADPTDGTGTGHYTFFSFKDNAIVPVTDSATNKWDIGLKATTIIINAGTSGPGIGGAQVYTGLFDDVAEAPESGYKIDNNQSSPPYAIPTGSGNGWYNYNSTTHVISPIPGRVLIIRTGDGKYAKVEILSYYKDAPSNPTSSNTSRYYTFRYVYQADGSRKLK